VYAPWEGVPVKKLIKKKNSPGGQRAPLRGTANSRTYLFCNDKRRRSEKGGAPERKVERKRGSKPTKRKRPFLEVAVEKKKYHETGTLPSTGFFL